jgi:hypothetical protein
MHVCVALRSDASKLFWNQSNEWYYCGPDWWRSHIGRFGKRILHCSTFATNVTQVEIDFGQFYGFTSGSSRTIRPFHESPEHLARSPEERAKFFWYLVQTSFSSLKRVALTAYIPYRDWKNIPPPSPGQVHEGYSPLSAVVSLAPSHITVFVGFRHLTENVSKTCLYRVDPESTWTIVHEDWARRVVQMPRRRTPSNDLRMCYLQTKQLCDMSLDGLEFLINETFVEFADGPGFECPLRCQDGERFATRDEWLRHWNHPGQDDGCNGIVADLDMPSLRPLYCPGTPADVQDLLEARFRHAVALNDSYRSLRTAFQAARGR